MENNNFLKQKYNLHNTPEIKSAAKRTKIRTGEKVPQNPSEQIGNYLDRFKEIINRTDPDEKEQGINALKKILSNKFATKYEDIPESWYALNERILRERGQGGDWASYSKENQQKEKQKQAEAVLADQEASLEQWIDYLASSDSAYMPDYIKYWTFRNVIELQEYDKEKNEFPKRSKGTVKMFPDINQEALAYVIDAVLKKQAGEGEFKFEQFEADLTDEQKKAFQKSLANENFTQLYSWANEQIHPIAKHLLPITAGKWIKYEQDDEESENYKKLNQSIRGRGTGWCTAGENTAKSQLQGGAFYCYYTLDDAKKPTIPRIAIRMDNDKIGEVRGIAYKQNLDPYMGDVLAEKLAEFPDKAEYLKKEADMKQLTEIENKVKQKEQMTKDDLVFIYEINSPINGFGYQKDPRIEEIRQTRNPKEDAPIIFECAPNQIAFNQSEITHITKVYIGPLFKDIFSKNLEYIYTSFPEGRIEKVAMTIGQKSEEELIDELETRVKSDNPEKKIYISNYVKQMIQNPEFTVVQKPKEINLVRLKVSDLGFPGTATTEQIYQKIAELGLELCPPEVGLYLRLEYEEIFKRAQPKDDSFRVGMKPIADSGDDLSLLRVSRRDGGQWLGTCCGGPSSQWNQTSGFAFVVSQVSPQN